MSKRYEKALHTAFGNPQMSETTAQQFLVLDFAGDVDRAERDLLEQSGRMVELFEQDIKRVQGGFASQGPMGYSCAADVARHKVELEERAKALRLMVLAVFGKDVRNALDAALETSRTK